MKVIRQDAKFEVFLYSTLYLAYEMLDHANEKKYFTRMVKKATKLCLSHLEKRVFEWVENLTDDNSKRFYAIVDVLKLTIKCAVYKDPFVLVAILKDIHEGNVMELKEPEKHGKFIRQNTIKVS